MHIIISVELIFSSLAGYFCALHKDKPFSVAHGKLHTRTNHIAFSRLMLCTLLVSCDNCSIIYCVSVCIETNLLPYTNLLLYTLGSLYNTLQFLQCTLISMESFQTGGGIPPGVTFVCMYGTVCWSSKGNTELLFFYKVHTPFCSCLEWL